MIKYALSCENDHEFEGWFSGSEEFERLSEAGHLDCPVCGSTKISKLLMAPSVKTTKGRDVVAQPTGHHTAVPQPAVPAANMPVAAAPAIPALPADMREKVVEHLREVRKHVLENAENVGDKFAEEARKIHYGESEQRGIYGNATPNDAAELLEEGVDVVPLPVLPEDRN